MQNASPNDAEFCRFHDSRGGDLDDGPVLCDVLGEHRDAAGARLNAKMPECFCLGFVNHFFGHLCNQTYEIMPTELRAQGVSLSRCLSQFARILSSYVVFSVRAFLESI